jgi:hypothetical protein
MRIILMAAAFFLGLYHPFLAEQRNRISGLILHR